MKVEKSAPGGAPAAPQRARPESVVIQPSENIVGIVRESSENSENPAPRVSLNWLSFSSRQFKRRSPIGKKLCAILRRKKRKIEFMRREMEMKSELMKKKLDFMKLQAERSAELHKMKMEILRKNIEFKKLELELLNKET